MPAIRIPGVPDPVVTRPLLAETVEGITPRHSARVEAGRGEQGAVSLDGAFVEIELSGGVRIWARTDTIAQDLGAGPSRDGGLPVLPTSLSFSRGAARGQSRGPDLAIQGVRTFDIQIAEGVAAFIKERVETGKEAGGRLFQCVKPNASAFDDVTPIKADGPTLVFIHGTASSTEGSFGGLWEAPGANRVLNIENPGARINELFKHYDGRVLAFEHRSLSESPIANALALVEQLEQKLPKSGAELHLVSHSRGGLIGELLCRCMRSGGTPFDAADLGVFAEDNRKGDRALLKELSGRLAKRKYNIGRFVRVACPAGGTLLADGRLDRYVNVLVNAVGWFSGLSADPTYKALTNLLALVLEQRTKPESLPGLEAMMPESPLVKMLNRKDLELDGNLHVLGGDLAVEGFWSALKVLATDFYYREDHDLVVNSPSMLRGAKRKNGVKYWIDTGGDVSHFNYFRKTDTAMRLVDILQKDKADLRDLMVPPSEVQEGDYQKRESGAPRPRLVFVPGFMGNHLEIEGVRAWADGVEVARGKFSLLAKRVKATPAALVGLYAGLIEHLSATHKIEPFLYDWRLSASQNAEALAGVLSDLLKADGGASSQPIRILTHGSGGLVLQALLASKGGPELWAQVCKHPGARAVVLGHPFGGTVHALLPLIDRGALLDRLAAVDLVSSRKTLRETLAGFDGLLELLPEIGPGTWKDSADVKPPDPKRLADARARRADEAKKGAFDLDRIVLVAGTASSTPVAANLTGDEPRLDVTADGDGYTPWEAIPETVGQAVQLAPFNHGGLVTSREFHPILVELLTTGRTQRLGALPPRERDRGLSLGSKRKVSTAPIPRLQEIPTDAELVAAGIGADAQVPAPPRRRVKVRVVHGNLSRADWPVIVGHYANDDFVSAEAYLDTQLGGRLRRAKEMGLYPGPIETALVAAKPVSTGAILHPGAIVVGLGVVGGLTPGTLLSTLENGLVRFGAGRVAERVERDQARARGPEPPDRPATTEENTPVTSLLVGSGEAGLTLRDSLHALLRAVKRANARLAAPAEVARQAQTTVPVTARIDKLDIYELYEDRAVQALKTLLNLMGDADLDDGFDVQPLLECREEGRQRVSFEEPAAWWQRLKVTEHDASIDPEFPTRRRVLKFEAYTERARIDAYAVNSLRESADKFIADAVGTTAASRNIGRTLFEMLVPNMLKDRAPDRRDTVLLLDKSSAAIPWELFEDGVDQDRVPRSALAIEAGLVRQLVEEYGRPQVRQATGRSALVIGDPIVDDPRFLPLDGAEAEARAVAAQLEKDKYRVECLVRDKATISDIETALHDRPWKVLHLAMHGVIDFPAKPPKDRPGVPAAAGETDRADCGDAGKPDLVTGAVVARGVYLTAADFNQMRFVPDLVFLNCCHVGSTAADARQPVPRYPELAANLATQFIKMGTKAVVAAGWAVDDGAAQAFAQTFYAAMLKGESFGQATLQARRQIYKRFPHVNTWGAYQCYGDPGFRLEGAGASNDAWKPHCVRELVIEVDALADLAKIAGDAALERLRKRLGTLVEGANEQWLRDATLLAAIGRAYGELSDFERAIDYYTRAGVSEKAMFPVKALEQLANLQARYAEHLWRDAEEKDRKGPLRATLGDRFDTAKATLERLNTFGESVERLSLLGGVAKRRAMTLADKAAIADALREMQKCYGKAYELAEDRGVSDVFWPQINAVVAQLARSWIQPAPAPAAAKVKDRRKKLRRKGDVPAPAAAAPSPLAKDIQELAAIAVERAKETDFWSAAFVAESALMSALDARTPDALASSELLEKYREAQQRGRSRRELDSIVTQVRFLAAMANASPAPDVKKLAPALERLAKKLTDG